MQTLCGLFGMSRQAWYDEQKLQHKEDLQAGLLLAEVRRLRLDLPSIGIDVLHYQLADFRQQHGIKIGRDKLANLLRDNGLLIVKRSRRVRTTWSHHRYFKYPNLTIDRKVVAPNQLWVGDITYILIGRGFGYLNGPPLRPDYRRIFPKDCGLGTRRIATSYRPRSRVKNGFEDQ